MTEIAKVQKAFTSRTIIPPFTHYTNTPLLSLFYILSSYSLHISHTLCHSPLSTPLSHSLTPSLPHSLTHSISSSPNTPFSWLRYLLHSFFWHSLALQVCFQTPFSPNSYFSKHHLFFLVKTLFHISNTGSISVLARDIFSHVIIRETYKSSHYYLLSLNGFL